jgi:hypothetical protein
MILNSLLASNTGFEELEVESLLVFPSIRFLLGLSLSFVSFPLFGVLSCSNLLSSSLSEALSLLGLPFIVYRVLRYLLSRVASLIS